MKNLDNPITRIVDFWLASVLEGFVTEFAVDREKASARLSDTSSKDITVST